MTTARQHTKTGCKHRLWCHPCGADSDVIGANHDQPAALANADLDRQFHRLKLITISELWLRRDGTPSIKAVKVRARSSSYGALTQVRLLRHPPYSGTPIHRTSCSRRPPRLQGCPALPSPKSTASEFRWLYPQLDPPLLRPCRSRRTTSSTCSATHNCRWCRSMSSKSLLAFWGGHSILDVSGHQRRFVCPEILERGILVARLSRARVICHFRPCSRGTTRSCSTSTPLLPQTPPLHVWSSSPLGGVRAWRGRPQGRGNVSSCGDGGGVQAKRPRGLKAWRGRPRRHGRPSLGMARERRRRPRRRRRPSLGMAHER
jgi:hypothetical protein